MKRRRIRSLAFVLSLKRGAADARRQRKAGGANNSRRPLVWALGLALQPFGGRVASAVRQVAGRMIRSQRGASPWSMQTPTVHGAPAGETAVRLVHAPARPELPEVLARSGSLLVRLAASRADILAAQRLRYQVFYEEMSAQPTPEMAASRRDFDRFDEICDILLVEDESRPPLERVVGTYRLLLQDVAERTGGFYSESEYDLTTIRRLFSAERRGLELGRSCVHRDYRNNASIQLLWRGIACYVAAHRVGWMFGCASLPGTDPDALAPQLAFLHHGFLAPPELRATARPELHVAMDRLPKEAVDEKRVLHCLPPLIKGYLRLGGVVGDGAVVDRQFGTTDIFVLVSIDKVAPRYFSRFDKDEQIQTGTARA